MSQTVSVTIESHLGEIAAQAEERATQIVAKTVADIEAGSKTRSRVRTGRMKNGWEGVMDGPFEGEVRNPVEYTIYNEFGTRHMAPQPMLGPSIDSAAPGFEAACGQLYS